MHGLCSIGANYVIYYDIDHTSFVPAIQFFHDWQYITDMTEMAPSVLRRLGHFKQHVHNFVEIYSARRMLKDVVSCLYNLSEVMIAVENTINT